LIGEFYSPEHERGLRADDARLGVKWPLPIAEMSDKDRAIAPLDSWHERLRREMTRA